MIPDPMIANPQVSIRIVSSLNDKIEIIDNLDITECLKESVLMPYLEAIWKSLLLQSESMCVGVKLYPFLEVFIFLT